MYVMRSLGAGVTCASVPHNIRAARAIECEGDASYPRRRWGEAASRIALEHKTLAFRRGSSEIDLAGNERTLEEVREPFFVPRMHLGKGRHWMSAQNPTACASPSRHMKDQ